MMRPPPAPASREMPIRMKRLNALVAIFLTIFVDLVGFGVIVPLLPFYGEHFHAAPDLVTLLMAIYSFTQFLFAPFWGRLSDRYGRKPVLMASLAGIALSYVWLGFADALWQLFAARALAGAMAGNIAAAQAYIADVTPPEKRAQGMGLIGAAFGLGFIFGPAIGGLLGGADPAHPHFLAPALTSAGLSLAALLFATLALDESLDPAARAALAGRPRPARLAALGAALRDRELGLSVLLLFLTTFVFAGMEATFAMWSERMFGWGATQNGYVFAYTGVLAALVQGGLIRRLAARFGERRLILQGAVALGLGLLLIPFSGSLALLLLAMALLAYGAGVSNPSLSSLVSLAAKAESRGTTLGVSQSAASLARILGPALAGASFWLLGRDSPFLLGATIMLAVVLLALRLPERKPAVAG
jgi:DHA1 family tetracycline resistance protein-like MFS transporter